MMIRIVLSLLVLVGVLLIPNPSFAKSYEDIKYDDFTKEYNHTDPFISFVYPVYWDLKYGKGSWIATFYDDIEEWEMRVDAYVYDIDKAVVNVVPQRYAEYMFVTYKTICEGRTYEKDGYLCFDFVPLDFKTWKQNDLKIQQIAFSWTQVYKDGNFFENTSTVTDILNEKYLLSVHYQTEINDHDSYSKEYANLINSITFDKTKNSQSNSVQYSSYSDQSREKD